MDRLSFCVIWRLALTVCLTSAAVATAAPPSGLALPADVEERCLAILREGLASDEFWPSMHAAEALTLAGRGDEVLTALAGRLDKETDDQKRCGLAREQVRAGDRSMTAAMLDILAKDDPYGHVHAAESLYKVLQVGDGVLLRRAAAQSDNVKLQLMAAGALARCGNLDAYKIIRQRLGGDDPDGRQIAAWLLAKIGDSSDVPQLMANLDNETDPLRRCYIENALACLGHPKGLASFEKNLQSDNPAVRTYAAEFAGDSFATATVRLLKKLLDDPVLDVRVRAAQSLLVMRTPPQKSDMFAVDVYPASEENPRISEGDIAVLRDGTLLFAVSEFSKGGSDHSTAQIVARRSKDGGRHWSEPEVLQPNVGGFNVMSASFLRLDEPRPGDAGPLGMFYLVKNSFTDLKVYLRISTDDAQTFGEPIVVTDAPGYHVMNNNRVRRLSSGRIICAVSTSPDVAKDNHFRCRCWFSDDKGRTWKAGADSVDLPKRGAMEPELVELPGGQLLMAMRNQLGTISIALSNDGGDTWSKPGQWTVQAPEAPSTIRRIPATGDLLLIWNDNYVPGEGHGGKRTPLCSAVSSDEGKTWTRRRKIETDADHTFAYTSLAFDQDRALLSYYVRDEKTGRISTRFRSIPVRWFYEGE